MFLEEGVRDEFKRFLFFGVCFDSPWCLAACLSSCFVFWQSLDLPSLLEMVIGPRAPVLLVFWDRSMDSIFMAEFVGLS